MNEFKKYCRELEYFKEIDKKIHITKNEIYNRKKMFWNFFFNVSLMILIFCIPAGLLSTPVFYEYDLD